MLLADPEIGAEEPTHTGLMLMASTAMRIGGHVNGLLEIVRWHRRELAITALPTSDAQYEMRPTSGHPLLWADRRFKPANVRMRLAANNVKQYSCFRLKLI